MTPARGLRAALGVALFALAAALLAPGAAQACAVCTGQDEAVGWAIFRGSLLLSMLPLAVIGGGVWYLRRRAREIQAAEDARRAASAAHRPPAARTA